MANRLRTRPVAIWQPVRVIDRVSCRKKCSGELRTRFAVLPFSVSSRKTSFIFPKSFRKSLLLEPLCAEIPPTCFDESNDISARFHLKVLRKNFFTKITFRKNVHADFYGYLDVNSIVTVFDPNNEFKSLLRDIDIPSNLLDVEKEMLKIGLKPLMNTSQRRDAAQIQCEQNNQQQRADNVCWCSHFKSSST
ncbi:hypothetical protein YC2023_041204 [Brassica napus]